MLEDVVTRIGTAAFVSATVGLSLNPPEPRYLIGAAIGIPTAVFLGGLVPADVGVPLGTAYLAGLATYAATSLTGTPSRNVEHLTTSVALLSGAAAAVIRYV